MLLAPAQPFPGDRRDPGPGLDVPLWSQRSVSIPVQRSLNPHFHPRFPPGPGIIPALLWDFAAPGSDFPLPPCERWDGNSFSRANRCFPPTKRFLGAAKCGSSITTPRLFLPDHPQLSDSQQNPQNLVKKTLSPSLSVSESLGSSGTQTWGCFRGALGPRSSFSRNTPPAWILG